uniref:GRAM domain containing 2A n=1 Tax=Pseudonaja textilis TaxID=8673 RepID=A0A670Z5G7_PSETE
APNKYNSQYHKLFKDIPTEERVVKVCSCALQRDILIQGRLYISPNWLCFYANLFGKDIKVVIPVVSVQLIKKHKTARLLPNGLAITTNASRKYIFVSLISRDSVYDVLRRVCTHLQVWGAPSPPQTWVRRGGRLPARLHYAQKWTGAEIFAVEERMVKVTQLAEMAKC